MSDSHPPRSRHRCAGVRRRKRRPARQSRDAVAVRDRRPHQFREWRHSSAVPQMRAGGAELRQRQRRREGTVRSLRQLRREGGAASLGHPPRDPQCARGGLRRRPDDPRREGAPVRRAARRGVHHARSREGRAVRSRSRQGRDQRGVPCAAQCARAGPQGQTQSRGVLGRPLDQRAGIPVHEEGRLRVRPARPRCVHGLRSGSDEGPDEGRHHRSREAAHLHGPLHRSHRARASSRPNRRMPS